MMLSFIYSGYIIGGAFPVVIFFEGVFALVIYLNNCSERPQLLHCCLLRNG
jgi:hypothetical protein